MRTCHRVFIGHLHWYFILRFKWGAEVTSSWPRMSCSQHFSFHCLYRTNHAWHYSFNSSNLEEGLRRGPSFDHQEPTPYHPSTVFIVLVSCSVSRSHWRNWGITFATPCCIRVVSWPIEHNCSSSKDHLCWSNSSTLRPFFKVVKYCASSWRLMCRA